MKSNSKYSFDLFDNFPDMYFLLSESGEILNVNSVAKEILKGIDLKNDYPEIFDLVEFCDRSEAQDILKKCVKELKSQQYQTRFFIKDKLININLCFSIPITGSDSEKNVIVAGRDITLEKEKEEDLLRFYNVSMGSVNPVLITDITGKMIYVNPAFTKITGYSEEELIGRNPKMFGSGKLGRKFWDSVWQDISSGKVWFGEVEDVKKNGEPFHSQLLISPIMDNDDKITGYFGIHRDLSEKRILEKQLIHTQKMESIGTLAAGIAHEVGNPLASISALVQVVRRDSEDPFIKEKLGLVKNQVTRISKIIRDLVDFSRPSNYELQLTDINQSITEAIAITRVGTKVKNIEFNVTLDENIPGLQIIPDQMQQVFLNILINAVDAFSEVEDNKKIFRIDVTTKVNNENVVVNFTDNGSGIKDKNLGKVFEPFFTTKEQGRGTGLGLWVSYGIVKSLQGDMKVDSEYGKGTTFTLTLPIET